MLAVPSSLFCAAVRYWPPLFVRARSILLLWAHRFLTCATTIFSLSLHQVLDSFSKFVRCFLGHLVSPLCFLRLRLRPLSMCVLANLFCRFHFTEGIFSRRLCQLAVHPSVVNIQLPRVCLLGCPAAAVPFPHRRHAARISYFFKLVVALTCYFSLHFPSHFVWRLDVEATSRQRSSSVVASLYLGKTAAACSSKHSPLRVETRHSLQLTSSPTSTDSKRSIPCHFLTASGSRVSPESASLLGHAAVRKNQGALCTLALLRSKGATGRLLGLILSIGITTSEVLPPSFIPLCRKKTSFSPNYVAGSVLFRTFFSTQDGNSVSAFLLPSPPRTGENVPHFSLRRCGRGQALPFRYCRHAAGSVLPSSSFTCFDHSVFISSSSNYRRASAPQLIYSALAVNTRPHPSLSSRAACNLSVPVPCTNPTERDAASTCRKCAVGRTDTVSSASPCLAATRCFLHVSFCERQCIADSHRVLDRRGKQQTGKRSAEGKRVGLVYKVSEERGERPDKGIKEEAATRSTRLYASLLGRRRLKIHDAEKVRKVLRRGVPLRYLDVSGNVHSPVHVFNPVQVLRFGAVLDRFLFPSTFSPLSAAEGGSLRRFLSMHATNRNGDPLSSYTEAAQQLRRIVSALLYTVHPVLRCMYTRWLRLQDPTCTSAHTANTAAADLDPRSSSSSYSAPSTPSSSYSTSSAPPSSSSSSSRMSSKAAAASPGVSLPVALQQHRIIACSKAAHSSSSQSTSNISSGCLPAAIPVASASGADNCTMRLALAIEGGAMRGCVTAGMAAALHHMGFADVFDAVYGSSAGSLVGAYFISRQLPYEGAQIYYDWLPYMGRKFLDMTRLGKDLGLGFLRHADILGFLRNKTGSPLINLDVLLYDLVQRRQPLDWEKFKRQDQKQPLKVIASGLHTQRAVVLESAAGHFGSFPSFLNCLRASMLMPGLAGPVVHVHALPPTSSYLCSSSSNTSDSSTSSQNYTDSSSSSSNGRSSVSMSGTSTSPSFPHNAAETAAATASSAAQLSASFAAVTADAAAGSGASSPSGVAAATPHEVAISAASVAASSSLRSQLSLAANQDPSPDAAAVAETSLQPSGPADDAVALSSFCCDSPSSCSSSSSPSSSPSLSPAPSLSLPASSSSAAAFVSEPLADALLYEPIPYRSALLQGYNRVLVLRSRPDGKRVGRLSGIEAAIENRMASRFFGETQQLWHVYDYVKQRQHRIRYMDDLLLLNEASNNQQLLRVVKDQQEQGRWGKDEECEQQEDAEEQQQQEEHQPLEGYAFAVSLTNSCAEVAKTTLKRKKILQGIREGFARLYDVLVPDPAKRGKGMEEAFKVFPEDLPCVTDSFREIPDEAAAAAVQPVPPAYDDSAEKQQVDAGVLGEYVLQAALAQDPRLICSTSSVIFASPSQAASVCEKSDAATAACPCSFSATQTDKAASA